MRMGWGAISLGAIALLIAGAAAAQEGKYTRGEFEFSIGPEPAFAQVQELPTQWDRKAPGHDDPTWRTWRFDEQVDRRAGRDLRFIDYAYEARSAELVGDAGRADITFNPLYQTLTIHRVDVRRGGRWEPRLAPDRISLARRETGFERDTADGQVTALIVLEDVRVGDVVRLRYSIAGSNPIMAGQLVDANRFGWSSPTLDDRLRVLYDSGTQVTILQENGAPKGEVERRSDATEVVFQMHGQAAVNDQGSYPVWYEPYPRVQVSVRRSWADVVAWALPLYAVPAGLPADLEAQVATWSSLPDTQARVDAALRLVQDQVRYFGVEMGDNTHRPNPPALTWARHYGDCKDKAVLLVALLKAMNIDAAPALVSADHGRGIEQAPPAAALFDHVVVRAQVDGQPLWIDPTRTSQGGSARASDLLAFGVGLPIRPGVTALEQIVSRPAVARVAVQESYDLLPDGKRARLQILTTYVGGQADFARRTIGSQRAQDISRQYAEHYRRRFGELDVIALPEVVDDRKANVLKVTEKYLLISPYERVGDALALDVYADAVADVTNLPKDQDRQAPLAFVAYPTHYSHAIQVRMPERWTTLLLDEADDEDSTAFKYTRKLSVADRRIDLAYELDATARDVQATQVASHLGALREVRDQLSSRLSVRPPAARADADSREERLKALLKDTLEGKNE